MAEPQADTKIIVYWLNESRAQRIVWLLEELNLQYEVKVFYRGNDMLAPKELKDVHPLGKSPVIGIKTPDREDELIIAESGAISEYLIDHYGKHLLPKKYPDGKEEKAGAETEEYLRYKYYTHYTEGSFMSMMVMDLVIQRIREAPVPFFIKPITRGIADKVTTGYIRPSLDTQFDFLESQLASSPGGGPWLCGTEITGADILMSFPVELSAMQEYVTETKHPKLTAYVKMVREREAYKRAVQKLEELTGKPFRRARGML